MTKSKRYFILFLVSYFTLSSLLVFTTLCSSGLGWLTYCGDEDYEPISTNYTHVNITTEFSGPIDILDVTLDSSLSFVINVSPTILDVMSNSPIDIEIHISSDCDMDFNGTTFPVSVFTIVLPNVQQVNTSVSNFNFTITGNSTVPNTICMLTIFAFIMSNHGINTTAYVPFMVETPDSVSYLLPRISLLSYSGSPNIVHDDLFQQLFISAQVTGESDVIIPFDSVNCIAQCRVTPNNTIDIMYDTETSQCIFSHHAPGCTIGTHFVYEMGFVHISGVDGFVSVSGSCV